MSTRCDNVVCVPAEAREYFVRGIHFMIDDSEQDEAVCIVFMLQQFFMNIDINYSPHYPQMIILTCDERTKIELSVLLHSLWSKI